MASKQLFSFENFISMSSDEKELVWRWRNHEAIRKWMYTTSEITFENHLAFIENLKNNTNKIYYLVKRSAIPIGVFSILITEEHEVDFGFYLGPEYINKKLSIEFYYYVLEYIFDVLHFKKVFGYVLVENNATNSLCELFGFVRQKMKKRVEGIITDYYLSELTFETWNEVVKTNKIILERLEQIKDIQDE
jgi:UDP-4-amino-4,6-dideoxy-N-acetyl-beta-L-altrosamine N-acetyltransferase